MTHTIKASHCILKGIAITLYVHRIWPYIWWFLSQKHRISTVYVWFWPTLNTHTITHSMDTSHCVLKQHAARTCSGPFLPVGAFQDSEHDSCNYVLPTSSLCYIILPSTYPFSVLYYSTFYLPLLCVILIYLLPTPSLCYIYLPSTYPFSVFYINLPSTYPFSVL